MFHQARIISCFQKAIMASTQDPASSSIFEGKTIRKRNFIALTLRSLLFAFEDPHFLEIDVTGGGNQLPEQCNMAT